MTKNKLSYTELKKRTETPQKIPFKASRLPAKNICIGEYMWEYPGVTSYTEIRFAHPSRIRPYWSLWTKTYCPMAEEFIHRVESAHLRLHVPYDANDSPDIITHYFMIDFLNDPDTECSGYETIGGITYDSSILYAAALSTEEPPENTSRIKKYVADSPSSKDHIISTAFAEFRDRVAERVDQILAN